MTLPRTIAPQQSGVSEPAYLKLHHAFFAVCMLLSPLTISLWFGLCPQYGDPACPNASHLSVLTAFREANPLLMQVFLFVNLMIPYVYPLSYIGLGQLTMKRSPWLTTIGIASGFVGSIVWSLFAGETFWLNDIARLGLDTQFAMLGRAYISNWEVFVMHGGWIIGHLLAYVLLGIALARTRVIPLWAAYLIIVSAPVMGPIAYGTGLGLLQILGYVLVFIGSIPAALAMLHFSDIRMGEDKIVEAND